MVVNRSHIHNQLNEKTFFWWNVLIFPQLENYSIGDLMPLTGHATDFWSHNQQPQI